METTIDVSGVVPFDTAKYQDTTTLKAHDYLLPFFLAGGRQTPPANPWLD